MADFNRGNRPLSPHLQVYRPQITSVSSILTRVTGNALIVAAVLIVWWFLAAATGPEAFDRANWVLTSWVGDIVMTLSVWGLWYHTLAGIRHVIWDAGRGLELGIAQAMGWGIIGGSAVLTLLTVIVV